jgi:hypothetical protein
MKIPKKIMASAMAMTLSLSVFSGGMSVASDGNRTEPTGGEMFVDALIVRPMTLAASVVGAATWVVTLPFTLFSGNAGDAGKSWVVDPLGYTFVRPLGDISDNR